MLKGELKNAQDARNSVEKAINPIKKRYESYVAALQGMQQSINAYFFIEPNLSVLNKVKNQVVPDVLLFEEDKIPLDQDLLATYSSDFPTFLMPCSIRV